jgi:hypothetical protein
MSQVRIFLYHDLESSQTFNTRMANVIRPGVYKGFRVRRNASSGSLLDISHGDATTSVLVTVEGVRIQETEELLGVLRIQPADPVYERIDLVVAEYQWSTNNDIQQVYRVLKGQPQQDLDSEPVAPQPLNQYQLPLAWVKVKPMTAIGGVARVDVQQEDILHVTQVIDTKAPEHLSSLKPIVDPTDQRRIFIYEGTFPTSDGLSYVEFEGGYSGIAEDTDVPDGETRYFLYGISDGGVIQIGAKSETPTIIQDVGFDLLSICVGKVVNRGGTITIDEITDVRFPFYRRFRNFDEENIYKNLLGSSVFKYAAIDTFGAYTFVRTDSVEPVDEGLTAVVNKGDTSLAVSWDGSVNLSADVTVATRNILDDTEISAVRHILVSVDSEVAGLKFDYSMSSAFSGFTGKEYELDSIVEIPGGASQLYIRFIIPKESFTAAGDVKKLFGYAILMQLDYDMLNEQTISGLGIDSLENSIQNLIANGDFRIWSRPLPDGSDPNIDGREKISYPIRPDGFAEKEDIFAGDGWQFTRLEFPADDAEISRIIWSRDVIGSLDENTIDTGLEWLGQAAGTGPSGKLNYLEYRVPSLPEYAGNKVTFAFDHLSTPREALGIRLVLYSRDDAGNLGIIDSVESGPLQPEGTLIVTSNLEITDQVYAAGFIIVLYQTNALSTVYVRRARAAIGEYRVLPFTRSIDAEDAVRKYYERGQAFASGNVEEGEEIGTGIQFGSKKSLGLSENEELRVRSLRDRSVNIVRTDFQGSRDGFVVRAPSATSGLAVIDTDWEGTVIYPESS